VKTGAVFERSIKGYKIGSIIKRITNRSPEIKEAFMALMKHAAADHARSAW
jgi:hypothetical protein